MIFCIPHDSSGGQTAAKIQNVQFRAQYNRFLQFILHRCVSPVPAAALLLWMRALPVRAVALLHFVNFFACALSCCVTHRSYASFKQFSPAHVMAATYYMILQVRVPRSCKTQQRALLSLLSLHRRCMLLAFAVRLLRSFPCPNLESPARASDCCGLRTVHRPYSRCSQDRVDEGRDLFESIDFKSMVDDAKSKGAEDRAVLQYDYFR